MTGRWSRPPLRVGIVDHGAGNLVSLVGGLGAAGARPRLVRRPAELAGADALVLPGVGAAGPAMRRLRRCGLVEALLAWTQAGKPLLGICLGLQLLMTSSEEDDTETLGLVPGHTVRLASPRLPHIGWNRLHFTSEGHDLLAGLPDGCHVAFAHSFVVQPDPGAATILAETTYGRRFPAAVARGGVVGVQFHPERSGPVGLRILTNFLTWVERRAAGRPMAAPTPSPARLGSREGMP